MSEQLEWQPGVDTWPKGATWWDRALPYAEGEGAERRTVIGDWWDDARLTRLGLWQYEVGRVLLRLMADDAVQAHAAAVAVLSARAARDTRAQLGGGWAFETWLENAQKATRPTPEEVPLIEAEAAKRRAVRDAIRALIVRWVEEHPTGRAAALFPRVQASVWNGDQLAAAAGRHSRLLLRLARRSLIPHPGDLVPPHLRDQPEVRDFTEPQTAGA